MPNSVDIAVAAECYTRSHHPRRADLVLQAQILLPLEDTDTDLQLYWARVSLLASLIHLVWLRKQRATLIS